METRNTPRRGEYNDDNSLDSDLKGDVEVGSDISSHPGIVYPEKLNMSGGLHYGRCCGGSQDVDPALTQSGPLSLVQIPRDTVLWLVEHYYNATRQEKCPILGSFCYFWCRCYGSLAHAKKGSIYYRRPYAIKMQWKARNSPEGGHFVPRPREGALGAFSCVFMA